MATGVNILCYKSKTLASGEHPLMIRICKDGKKKYIGLGISILPQFWDFKKNKPKRNCPNKEKIEKLIASKITEYNSLIVELTTDQREYTAEHTQRGDQQRGMLDHLTVPGRARDNGDACWRWGSCVGKKRKKRGFAGLSL